MKKIILALLILNSGCASFGSWGNSLQDCLAHNPGWKQTCRRHYQFDEAEYEVRVFRMHMQECQEAGESYLECRAYFEKRTGSAVHD